VALTGRSRIADRGSRIADRGRLRSCCAARRADRGTYGISLAQGGNSHGARLAARGTFGAAPGRRAALVALGKNPKKSPHVAG
jgi:hypothetical protein